VISALSISGIPSADFTFLGFLPHKKGRQTLFKEIAVSERTMIFYESPHRIMKTLESLKEFLPKTKRVVVARELTKMFEQVVRGTAEEVLKYFEDNKDKVRGEFVVLVSPEVKMTAEDAETEE
ncbi:MAG: SAM-dependent methyltransferase, partial [bacterium]